VIALLAALTLQAPAAPVRPCELASIESCYTAAHHACMQREVSTQGIVACIAAERARQDRALNETYRRVLARLNPRQRTSLRSAQRAWIAYRDARCLSLYDEDWGTLSRITAADCGLTMTIERTLDLQDHPPQEPG
jgi:uncharacterized protein YecT (DUF1311 family)